METLYYDSIIVGSGLAGLSTALRLANNKQKVALITKRHLKECNSYYAQGGIAAVLDNNDSVDNHIRDTLIAGAGLCNEPVVRHIIEHSPKAIEWLIKMGVKFTPDEHNVTGFHLTKEGGHSFRRILHVADTTGAAIINTLALKVAAHPNITLYENFVAIDLIIGHKIGLDNNNCYGIYILNRINNKVYSLGAKNTVLATGGAGKVYLYTTNPDVATGDGIAMAYRAGCRIANMEFIQFHPTCLFHPRAKSFLISEAVRGEGGILKLPNGQRFMAEHDARLELAPRDITARAIDFEMKKHGLDHVNLDISYKSQDFIKQHFPNIYQVCKKLGIDITQEPIPVVPAAHYTCGGIMTNISGETDIPNLYAAGECAFTGLHGANRLASNSLLECLVIGEGVAESILESNPNKAIIPDWDSSQVIDNDEQVIISHNWDELRRAMWDYVGIIRTNKRLERALHRIQMLKAEVYDYYSNFKLSADLIELRNLLVGAELIVKSAMLRHESRGLHHSKDFPQTVDEAKNTILQL
ncbi:MAG: L-aspartate oxidase [Burkholderiales bacterium]|nr:L-aspartate oxidase [Burkholderiales bacterium]